MIALLWAALAFAGPHVTCTRGVGLVGGAFYAGISWNFLGRPIVPAGSPTLSFDCDTFPEGAVGWTFGASTAPLYRQLDLANSRVRGLWIEGRTGLRFVSGDLRWGPYLGWSLLYGAVGANVVFPLADTKKGRRHAIEARAAGLVGAAPGGQVTVLYRFGEVTF